MFIVTETQMRDRWDLIAERVYGDSTRFGEIIKFNPQLPIFGELPAGITVFAPLDIETQTPLEDTEPAWRRDDA
jgi:hypothetical protein